MAYFGFTNKFLKGETIKIFNYGNCMRDFTYIDDIVEGVIRIMAKRLNARTVRMGYPSRLTKCIILEITNQKIF